MCRLVALLASLLAACTSASFDVASEPDGATSDSIADSNLADAVQPGDATIEDVIAPDSNVIDAGGFDTTVTADTGPIDAGASCTVNGDCAPLVNHYCKFAGCEAQKGTCTPYGVLPGPYYAPVCGCDGITYWNKEYAFATSSRIKHDGMCLLAERKHCAELTACGAGDSICAFDVGDQTACVAGMISGGCWRLPTGTLCTTPDLSPSTQSCPGTCMTYCNAVKSKVAFAPYACTPM
jgi:hypothetical protein